MKFNLHPEHMDGSSLLKEELRHQEETLTIEQFEDSYRNNIGIKIKSDD